jgi:hypothetical protein
MIQTRRCSLGSMRSMIDSSVIGTRLGSPSGGVRTTQLPGGGVKWIGAPVQSWVANTSPACPTWYFSISRSHSPGSTGWLGLRRLAKQIPGGGFGLSPQADASSARASAQINPYPSRVAPRIRPMFLSRRRRCRPR